MCTLILARDVLGPGTVLLGANRDERAQRPSSPPEVLRTRPWVVGGRDRLAGGTWLALREERAAVALLNRRDPDLHHPPSGRRSRGLLTLDVACASLDPPHAAKVDRDAAEDLLAQVSLQAALDAIGRHPYAPFTLVYASPISCWLLAFEGGGLRVQRIDSGWHVLTHRDLDDPSEPRTAHLLADLAPRRPVSRDDAQALLLERLRSHGEDGGPPVCLHDGAMVTVSSSIVWIDEQGMGYLHAEGRPCVTRFEDRAALFEGARRPEPRP